MSGKLQIGRGRQLTLPAPGSFRFDSRELSIDLIAETLATKPRFAGQLPWANATTMAGSVWSQANVCAHSVWVARLLQEWNAPRRAILLGLLHDGPEFILNDWATPIKRIMPAPVKAWYGQLENGLMTAIWELTAETPPAEHEWDWVRRADEAQLIYEAFNFFPNGPVRESAGGSFADALVDRWQDSVRILDLPPPMQSIEDFRLAFATLSRYSGETAA